MKITLSKFSKEPLYQQIVQELKRNILSGELQEEEQLPSIRQLAKDLEVSVITVKKAYEKLEQENFLMTV
ncbi:GntR family transcriptional regulator, partial [Pauljensenia sp. UMB3104]|nr:GntR family transcriptional regulator [Pauljensenia sp. UMB3104]